MPHECIVRARSDEIDCNALLACDVERERALRAAALAGSAGWRERTGADVRQQDAFPSVLVVRERSDLAARLRASGWRARGGWRATASGTDNVWYVRFEAPEVCVPTPFVERHPSAH